MNQGYYTNIYSQLQQNTHNDKSIKTNINISRPKPRESEAPVISNNYSRIIKEKQSSFTHYHSQQNVISSITNNRNEQHIENQLKNISQPPIKHYVNPYNLYPQSSIQPRISKNLSYQQEDQKKMNEVSNNQYFNNTHSKETIKYETQPKKSYKQFSIPTVSTPNKTQPSTKRIPRFSEPAMYNNQQFKNQTNSFTNAYSHHLQNISSNNSQHSSTPATTNKYSTTINDVSNFSSNSSKIISNNFTNKYSSFSQKLSKQKQTDRRGSNVKISDFIKGAQLGSGKFGTVYIARHKQTGFLCAIKQMSKKVIIQQNIINQFIRQLKIQSCLDHPNIIKLFGFFHDKDKIYLVLQLGSQGQLYKIIQQKKRLSQATVSFIIRQLCQAVKYFHSLNVIHRDIKPQNIVLQYGTVKICDFGWSVCRSGELRSTFCGTPLYVSPEILKGQLYDQKIDIWALGILTYQLLIGDTPFEIFNQEQLVKIIVEDISFPSDIVLSDECKDFVLKFLKKNPDERTKISKLIDHPFLQRKVQVFDIQI